MADDISIIVDSSDVVKASKDVGNLEANVGKLGDTTRKSAAPALERGIKGINQFGKVASTGGKDMNRFNMVLQQGGYQLQDFIVQLQGGTSFFTAFSQQGSQFAGIFGPAGAVFGAVIALGSAIGGLSFALLKAQKDTRSLEETLDDLTKSVLEYSKSMDAAKDASAAATKEFGFTSSVLQKIIQDFKTLAKIRAFEDLGSSIEKLRSEHIQGFESDLENIKDLLRLEGYFAAAGEEVAQFNGLLKNLENSSLSLGERISSAMSLKDILLENSGGIKNMEQDQRAFYESLLTTIQQMEVLRGLSSDETAASKRNAYTKEMVQVFRDAQKRMREEEEKTRAQREENILSMIQVFRDAQERMREEDRKTKSEREENILSMIQVFRDAQKRMRDEEVAKTEESLQRLFRNRTVMYSIRFSGDADVMSQSLEPSGKMKPKQSYQELIGMGWSASDLERVGVNKPRGTGGGGASKKSPAEELQEYLDKLQQQADLESQLVGLFGEKRNIEEEVIKARQKYGKVFTSAQEAELRGTLNLIEADKERQRVLEEAVQIQEDIASSIANNFGDAFMSIVDGTKTAKEAFKDMARAIIKDLFRILVVEQMVKSVKGFFGFADGGAFSGGSQIQAYADGGVVGGPTFFPMAGGKTGLMGEAGPEAIMPLKRGANGKLGVQMEGGSDGGVNIVQNFNFQANGDDSVKKLIAQAAPQIANMTQKQIMDSRRRGGSMKAAFG